MLSLNDTFLAQTRRLADLLTRCDALGPKLDALGHALMRSWKAGGKMLTCGNGGSAADAMHFAEELTVRFNKNRRPYAALALLDPTVLTCAGNDMGYDAIFERQVEALGKPGDVLVVLTTSGNSPNCVRAVEIAKKQGLTTVSFLGKTGGKLAGVCDIELLVPSDVTHHIQEVHKVLFHALCVWLDEQ
ncbi:MAG: SIS domain-containing protein [Tepidisphaeraceae bacterium]